MNGEGNFYLSDLIALMFGSYCSGQTPKGICTVGEPSVHLTSQVLKACGKYLSLLVETPRRMLSPQLLQFFLLGLERTSTAYYLSDSPSSR